MKYPSLLKPKTTTDIKLPSGKVVPISKASPMFELWTGEPVSDTYGNKPILNINGKPAFAELAILRILQADGWDGVWIDTYRNSYRTEFWPRNSVQLPIKAEQLLRRIYQTARARIGCWDVFCWKGRTYLFAESKRQGRDRFQTTQRLWLEAAINCGLPLASFLVVEWSTNLSF